MQEPHRHFKRVGAVVVIPLVREHLQLLHQQIGGRRRPDAHDVVRQVWVERLSWEKCIDSYDRKSTFFYVDPPYRVEGAKSYRHFFTDEDHARLADRLLGARGKWLLSYNDDEFIRRLYRGKGVKIEPLAVRYGL